MNEIWAVVEDNGSVHDVFFDERAEENARLMIAMAKDCVLVAVKLIPDCKQGPQCMNCGFVHEKGCKIKNMFGENKDDISPGT